MNCADNKIIKTKTISKIKIIGIAEKTIFLLLYLSSLTSLETLVGRLNCDNDINKEKVGNINMYKLIPSNPINLVLITLITIPNTLVIKPPMIKIIVDLINFSLVKLYHPLKHMIFI